MEQWMIYTKKADFNSLGARYGISPVIARIMINRGIREEDFGSFLYGKEEDMHDPLLLKDMEKGADIILSYINKGKKIRIVGDYDIDGVCATYILYSGLKMFGADVSYAIPDRVKDGYGINTSMIDDAYAGGVELIVTCDNGISAAEAVKHAGELGIGTVITDHHEVPEVIPGALAVIDPKQRDDSYPFSDICGGMVAYKLLRVLCEKTGTGKEALKEFLEFAAIATVGDVMPLVDENRIAVREGLRHIGNTSCKGLSALIGLCGLDKRNLTSYSVGYVIGPCLNAGGRLENAYAAMDLLLAENESDAMEKAVHLKELNDRRKELTEKFAREALDQAEGNLAEDPVKIIYLPGCHESVAGIIAGRVKEATGHPCIVFADSGEGILKGSGRSVDAYNMFEKLSEPEISGMCLKFGGHKLAAGLSIKKSSLFDFRYKINRRAGLTEEDMISRIWIDAAMPFGYISESLCDQLKILEPFGQGNEKPVFALKQVMLNDARLMGKNRNCVKMRLIDENNGLMEGLCFGEGDKIMDDLAKNGHYDILYYPQVNEYLGRRSVQIIVKGWKQNEKA